MARRSGDEDMIKSHFVGRQVFFSPVLRLNILFCLAVLWVVILLFPSLVSASVFASERELVAAEPAPWQVGLSAGVLGFGAELSRGLSAHYSLGLEFQYGQLSSERDLEDEASYALTSRLRHYRVQGRFYPWQEGAYAQVGVVYSDHTGYGRWREYPTVLTGVEPIPDQPAFDYRFSPLALSLGVGWQGAYAVRHQVEGERAGGRIEFGLLFDLIVHGSSEVFLSPWVSEALSEAAASELRKAIESDLDDSKVLPNLAVRLAYVF